MGPRRSTPAFRSDQLLRCNTLSPRRSVPAFWRNSGFACVVTKSFAKKRGRSPFLILCTSGLVNLKSSITNLISTHFRDTALFCQHIVYFCFAFVLSFIKKLPNIMKYRLALDVGTNSLGWAILNLDDQNNVTDVHKLGVRIFSDGRVPKDKQTLATARRLARGARRRRDRFLRRRDRLIKKLIKHRLFPKHEVERKLLEHLDPYELRSKGLQEQLSLGELARAIFHMNQRRGFKSNRISDVGKEEDEGLITGAVSKTRAAMLEGTYPTVGAYLYSLHKEGKPTRARRQGEANEYELYVDRAMIEEEFSLLWEFQQQFNPKILTDEAGADLKDTLLFQRSLRPVESGWCTLIPEEHRAALALPVTQHFRMYQELNNLRIVQEDYSERGLRLEERDALFNELEITEKLTFAKIRRAIGCERHERINLEISGRKHLSGNVTAYKLSDDECLGSSWFQFSSDKQNEIVGKMLDSKSSDENLIKWLKDEHSISDYQAKAVAGVRLIQGYGNLSRMAMAEIVPHLAADVITYDKAAAKAGFDHSAYGVEEIHGELPYYGKVLPRYVSGQNSQEDDENQMQYGTIANPTVHIALNQIRKVVNGLIQRYDKPSQIVVEVTRDLKLSERQKKEIEKTQKTNRDQNQKYADELSNLGLPNNYQNRLRFKLWESLNPEESLNRRCPYTGESIGIVKLFSPEIEIDHIIPFSRSLDDSVSNKVVCTRKSNRAKGDRTPFEAFGSNGDWDEIVTRAAKMPAAKARRFTEDSAAQTQDQFLARQLNDTAYIAKVAREYLTSIIATERVWAVPGRLTAMLRHGWGLNSVIGNEDEKERNDHRHHAIDAVVVGCTDRSILNKISKASANEQAYKVSEFIHPPFENIRIRVISLLARTLVSHKPDHGVEGVLHNATAYGLASEPDERGIRSVVTRKALVTLKAKQIQKIRDNRIRTALQNHTAGLSGVSFTMALKKFGVEQNIKRIRILERLNVREIKNKDGIAYKGFKPDGNHCVEIVVEENGKWSDEVILSWDANTPEYRSFSRKSEFFQRSFSGKILKMRLFRGDAIAVEEANERKLLQVCKFSPGKITLGPIEGSNLDARDRDNDDPFKFITKSANSWKQMNARKVFITPIGELRDPKG